MTLHEQLQSARERQRLQDLLAKGSAALTTGGFDRATEYFLEAHRLNPSDTETKASLKQALLKSSEAAEHKGNLWRARAYSQKLLAEFPDDAMAKSRLTDLTAKLSLRYFLIGGAIILIGWLILAFLNHFILWPAPACDYPAVGSVICTPSFTPTLSPTATSTQTFTATATLTPTSTATATFTLTPSLTPTFTATFTPTNTPTPMPFIGRVIYDYVAVYDTPNGEHKTVGIVLRDAELHLCAQTTRYYLVSLDYCHITKPLGWVQRENILELFPGELPADLTTPTQ